MTDQTVNPFTGGNMQATWSGVPPNYIGSDGCLITDITTGNIYVKQGGVWVATYTNNGGSASAGATLRNIATRCRTSGFQNTSNFYGFSRTMHINRGSGVNALQLVFSNWYATFSGEFPTADTMDITAAIEYPLGTYTRVTFSGGVHGTIAAGSNIVSDSCAVAIPQGARFWVRSIHNKSSGVFTSSAVSGDIITNALGGSGDQYAVSTTAFATDYTVNAYGGGSTTNPFFPTAVLGLSNVPSVIIYGDSRASGLNDAPSQNYGLAGAGEIARQLDAILPYTNLGAPTDQLTTFLANSTRRTPLVAYHTHVHCQYGINDVTAGRTAVQIEADMVTFLAKFNATYRVSQSTLLPRTTSTDAWATLANQTVTAQEAVRVAVNAYIRARTIGWWAVFENADVVESSRDSGKWKTVEATGIIGATTGDGTHPTPYGYGLLQFSGAINPRAFS